ncbi:hypothetical protein AB0C52_29115 [Streptomyces sp. NPDC048717]|uniref:hypothetical protein n=1 Tax=Streptomyces sp. NPDC048717 TaxID=3154928 RepID=UPI003446DB79
MNALHQYLFDSYRSARLGEAPPPAPGTHDLAALRAARDHTRFEAVLAGRPASGRLRWWLRRTRRASQRGGSPEGGSSWGGSLRGGPSGDGSPRRRDLRGGAGAC